MSEQLSRAELIKLCAVDSDLFARVYFPKAVRQKSPDFDKQLWAAIENPLHRLLNLRVFRGAGKTTKLRLFAAKRIAYNVSKTILYIGASESHATRSIQWLRARIDPGIDDTPIWVLGVGVTGNIRGINFDDYRPDLIIVDDCITDENAATQASAEKTSDLILNAVANSLASSQEFPNAKLAMLQTPISNYDISVQAEKDPEWHTESFGCWTKETEDLQIPQQRSSWEEMFPTKTLQARKQNAIAQRRYSGFAKEMECKLVQSETTCFNANWLRLYDEVPRRGSTVIAIDPVPPPSDKQLATNLKTKDYEAISVVSRVEGNYYLLDYAVSRGHDPQWTEAKLFEFALQYKPLCVVVEAVAAQRYLKWFLQKAMERRRRFIPIKETPNDQRSKFHRIVTSLNGVASAGRFWCSKHHSEFIVQFENYGQGYKGPDDLIESVSVAVSELTMPLLELGLDEYTDTGEVSPWPRARTAP